MKNTKGALLSVPAATNSMQAPAWLVAATSNYVLQPRSPAAPRNAGKYEFNVYVAAS